MVGKVGMGKVECEERVYLWVFCLVIFVEGGDEEKRVKVGGEERMNVIWGYALWERYGVGFWEYG